MPGPVSATDRHRHRAGPVAVDDGKVGVAEAGGLDPDQQLVAAGGRQFDFLDMQGLAVGVGAGKPDFVQDGGSGLHGSAPSSGVRFSLSDFIDNRLRQTQGRKSRRGGKAEGKRLAVTAGGAAPCRVR